jgi:hypothetical protein
MCVNWEKGLRFSGGIWRSRYPEPFCEVEQHNAEDLTVSLTALLQILMCETAVHYHHYCINDLCDLFYFTCHKYCINISYFSV